MLSTGGAKYELPGSELLTSSEGRAWPDVHVELRRHGAMALPSFVQPVTEVAIVVGGRGTVRRSSERRAQDVLARPGTCFLCPGGVPVDYLEGGGGLDVLHVYLAGDVVARARLRYEGGFRDPLVRQLGLSLLDEFHDETAAGSLLVESVTHTLAMRLSLAHAHEPMRAPDDIPLEGWRLRRALEYAHAHIGSDLRLEALAAAAGLSRFHFARAFKQQMGRSPMQYVAGLRFARARELLERDDRSIKEIAFALQFSSPSNFTRAFRRAFGVAPGAVRRRQQ